MKKPFINRERELGLLAKAWDAEPAQLLVVYGRRRIGKTALLSEFSGGRRALHFVATRLPEAQQLMEFGKGLGTAVDDRFLASAGFQSWEQVFAYLENLPERLGVIIDEFPYLAEANPALSSLWQRAWDLSLSDSKVFIVLCGSSMAMMEREILSEGAPLFGRRTGQLKLGPLEFQEAGLFLPKYRFADRVRAFAVTGGVPHYLQLWDDNRSVISNIRERVLDQAAPLRDEVEFLLRQELREPRVYFGILSAIAAGKRKLAEIINATGLTSSTISKYLSVLQGLGFIEREVPATEKMPHKSKRGLYRITDPFVRFWFRFVFPQHSMLELGRIDEVLPSIEKDFDLFVSQTYEEICRREVALGLLDSADGWSWTRVGRWWSRQAEVDLVAMSRDGSAALFGEIKWSRRPVGTNILADLENAATGVPLTEVLNQKYVLFSRSGFTDALLRIAGDRDDLLLVEGLNSLN